MAGPAWPRSDNLSMPKILARILMGSSLSQFWHKVQNSVVSSKKFITDKGNKPFHKKQLTLCSLSLGPLPNKHTCPSFQECLPSKTNRRGKNPELSDKSYYGKVCPTRSLFEQQQFNSQLKRFCCNLSAAKSKCKRWKITNVLSHPGHKQQHFKIFRIGTNSSREQC